MNILLARNNLIVWFSKSVFLISSFSELCKKRIKSVLCICHRFILLLFQKGSKEFLCTGKIESFQLLQKLLNSLFLRQGISVCLENWFWDSVNSYIFPMHWHHSHKNSPFIFKYSWYQVLNIMPWSCIQRISAECWM